MNDQFSLARLGYLLRGDFISRYRSLLLVSSTLAILMLLHGLLVAAFNSQNPRNPFEGWALGMFVIWGSIAASRAFVDLHDKSQNEGFLLLPASALEKVASRVLLTTVGLAVFMLLLTNVVALLSGMLAAVLFQRTDMFFAPVGIGLGGLGLYLAQQSVFLVGAAWFRKGHYVKTAFAVSVALVALVMFLSFTVRILFPELSYPFDSELLQIDMVSFYEVNEERFGLLIGLFELICFVALPIVCWALIWMRVKEAQVSHGV